MSEREGTLREAARKLIGAYMADDDLTPHINALEAAAGFMQQGSEREGTVVRAPCDRESDTRCDTAAPSDEAVEVAILTAAYPDHDDGHTDTYYAGILTAAYVIDWPRREAEVRAEERAATLREVERALNRWQAEAEQIGHHSLVDAYKAVRGALAAHFNPEAER